MVDYALLLLLIAATGAVAGLIAGMLGIGGGVVIVPALYYVFEGLGYESDKLMQVCVATSCGTIIFNSLRSVSMHGKRGAVDWSVLKLWGPAIATGALLGSIGASSLRSANLSILFGVIGIALSGYMMISRPYWRLSEQLPGKAAASAYGAVIGLFSSMMGIGGGSFGVPAVTLHGVSIQRAVATSSGFGLIISLPAFFAFLASGWSVEGLPPGTAGFVNLPALVLIVAFSTLTVPVGVRLAHHLPAARLKIIFAAVITLTSANMLIKGLGGL
ncbi:sulfite exporter TauE/SafE family protein [Agrobacterium rosae]|uniref:Probable membrane transporter protein n=1 Tax=Agrobacterium rosae TaxID=1972867 RepID=A0AAW9FGE7_9HYPH|nr:sulfite exporter TauE/SafE family protein [Agrobacterium rosae]MDX8304444.1 sulfite exporter TauE/SafE family protein [Agrobacterium rosae]